MERLKELLERIMEEGGLIKAVFSRHDSREILKITGRIVLIKGERMLQFETFTRDGKALQRNVPEKELVNEMAALAIHFRQIDLFTSGGNCEVLISKSGNVHINNGIRQKMLPVQGFDNDRAHTFILDPTKASSFLSKLGVCDRNGRIYDKKRSKFKQINRFVEILDDTYGYLPEKGTLTVCDLCCGKSYLTFAVYYYLTVMKGRDVVMYGIDRKEDVIEYCRTVKEELGFDGLHFECGDISAFEPAGAPSLIVSLHACDIATDVVIRNVLRLKAGVALLTPCCHHEMNGQIACESLSFVLGYSMYRQKLCDALTDALRCKRLEANGYKVTALELIDPEETPKNVLIKAIRVNMPKEKRDRAMKEYRDAVEFLSVDPYLDRLLKDETDVL